MLENLRIPGKLGGLLYLAEAMRNPPVLASHRHVELELNLVVRGEITYIIDGRRMSFGQRALLWMFPAQEHRLVDRSADARYYVAVFKPGLIRAACRSGEYRALREAGARGGAVVHGDLEAEAFDLLCRLMDELIADGPDAETLNREAGFGAASDFTYGHRDPDWLNAGLRHLLLLAWRLQRGRDGDRREVELHPAVARAIRILGESEGDEDLAALARRCGVSPSYLSRMFRRQVGVTLTRYRNSVRLARFWQFQRGRESRNLLDSAYAAGFGSYAQFHRVFTAAYGAGPRACSLRPAGAPCDSI